MIRNPILASALICLVAAVVCVLALLWLHRRFCENCHPTRYFWFSMGHAHELLQQFRETGKPCVKHVAQLEDGTFRTYTYSTTKPVAVVYKRHFGDMIYLGQGHDLGPMGWWQ